MLQALLHYNIIYEINQSDLYLYTGSQSYGHDLLQLLANMDEWPWNEIRLTLNISVNVLNGLDKVIKKNS